MNNNFNSFETTPTTAFKPVTWETLLNAPVAPATIPFNHNAISVSNPQFNIETVVDPLPAAETIKVNIPLSASLTTQSTQIPEVTITQPPTNDLLVEAASRTIPKATAENNLLLADDLGNANTVPANNYVKEPLPTATKDNNLLIADNLNTFNNKQVQEVKPKIAAQSVISQPQPSYTSEYSTTTTTQSEVTVNTPAVKQAPNLNTQLSQLGIQPIDSITINKEIAPSLQNSYAQLEQKQQTEPSIATNTENLTRTEQKPLTANEYLQKMIDDNPQSKPELVSILEMLSQKQPREQLEYTLGLGKVQELITDQITMAAEKPVVEWEIVKIVNIIKLEILVQEALAANWDVVGNKEQNELFSNIISQSINKFKDAYTDTQELTLQQAFDMFYSDLCKNLKDVYEANPNALPSFSVMFVVNGGIYPLMYKNQLQDANINPNFKIKTLQNNLDFTLPSNANGIYTANRIAYDFFEDGLPRCKPNSEFAVSNYKEDAVYVKYSKNDINITAGAFNNYAQV